MNLILLSIILWLAAPVAHAESVANQVQESLEMWEPHEVSVDGSSLVVISKERQVTDRIYRAIIGGICLGTISRPNSLRSISEIKVLNQFGRQGYVFEGGETECKEFNDMPINRTETYILGITHMHSN